jgi:hypothetical protein
VARRFKTQAVKANKPYEVDELAVAACVSIATVRNWLKDGMEKVDENRPTMIMGFQALHYLKSRKANSKRPLKVGEFYCLRCKAPKMPFGAMADYMPTSAKGGRLMALCEACEGRCNRNISASDLPAFSELLAIENRGVADAYKNPPDPS